ncbi:GAF domain-containing sensor histidine kinase [Steroidobacter sp.]|uniref:GAF domain-containing sensor histidine kinase n=1 Tax=Steroidobacter sp. TaxID=1978227 RepID=UPI001A4EEE8D|nr:GAF domain-containing sensor histidine kinase [Steroidobacter sp.]MBL8271549.1 GAF domain-containing sensor histidine kinase [Steroidobacter sp.]
MSSGILRIEGRDTPAMSEPFNTILEEIASELELRPLLTSIITRACGLLGAEAGAIGLYVPRRHTVQVEAIHQLPLTELGLEFEPGEGLIGKVLASGRPVIFERYGELERISLPERRDYAVIGVPIPGPGGGLLGVFGIGTPAPRTFDASDLETLQLFARHAAIAIQNAMRYEREKRRTERMTLIAHIARVITAGLEANELVATAAQVIHEHLGYPNVVIPLLYRDDDEEFLLFDGHAGNYGDVLDLAHSMPVTKGVTGTAVLTRTAQVVNDVRKDPRYVPPPIPINVRTELAMPIVLGDEVFGCINIEGLNPFDEDDVASIQIIADHLAVAIKNTSLSREARQAAVMRERQRLARDLHDAVSQALSSISLMSQSIVPAWRRDPAEGERRARRIEELARLAFAEMRALLRELRPDPSVDAGSQVENAGVADVKKMGLAAALQRFAFILAPQTPSIRLDFAAYQSQPPSLEERLYLICREALSNAIRHSGADRLDVSAGVKDDVLMLNIQDNGRGFDVAARAEVTGDSPEQGIGLQTMSERAATLGGVCEVQSQPGRGTTVCIRIPLLAITP